jgi:outer membrane murein-binding lipoprotein Lpp
MNKKIVASGLLIAILFVSAIAGITFYYSSIVNDGNSKINSLNSQIVDLNSKVANLTSQLHVFGQENLTTPSIVSALGATEIPGSDRLDNRLWISGTVSNIGEGTAFNVGLHVLAYASNGTTVLNLTVPVNNNDVVSYGSQEASLSAYVSNGDNNPSYFLPSLAGGGIAYIGINVFHADAASNWTVTPVWTNIP